MNDTSTAGDSWCTAIGADTGIGTADTPFLSIDSALAAASAGDTIYIDAGTYSETVVIDSDYVSIIL
ncbi:MAG: DUF1565 domain-containing protein [Candidatus Hydrogenedentota bacterium]